MKNPKKEPLVPRQRKGSRTGASFTVKKRSAKEARALFYDARRRLMNINAWYDFCGEKGAEFYLTDASGRSTDIAHPEVGYLIRIRLPGPKNEQGHGFDWVRIEQFVDRKDVETDEEVFGFRVRPVSNPLDRSQESAHFYTSDATSTFLVVRRGKSVCAMERGRNEKPNPKAAKLSNRIRNVVVALGAKLGLAVPQWKRLMKGIVKPKKAYR